MTSTPPTPAGLWDKVSPDAQVALLLVLTQYESRTQILEARVAELEQRLRTDASNSSLPPSANPPGAHKPVVKKPTGRKSSGQAGHCGLTRQGLPVERVDHVIPLIPSQCEHCQAPLAVEPSPGDPKPTWHQVAELPRLLAVGTEFQGHARRCPCCQHVTRESIPSEITADVFGPRLAASLSYLTDSQHVSQQGLEELIPAKGVFHEQLRAQVGIGQSAGHGPRVGGRHRHGSGWSQRRSRQTDQRRRGRTCPQGQVGRD